MMNSSNPETHSHTIYSVEGNVISKSSHSKKDEPDNRLCRQWNFISEYSSIDMILFCRWGTMQMTKIYLLPFYLEYI